MIGKQIFYKTIQSQIVKSNVFKIPAAFNFTDELSNKKKEKFSEFSKKF